VLAVTALGAGIVALIVNFKAVSDFLNGPMGTAISVFIASFMPIIGIPMLIIGHWAMISGFFKGVWHDVETAFNGIVEVAKTLWDALTGDSGDQEKVKKSFTDLPGEIMSALSTGGRQIADFGSKIPGWIMSGVSTVGDFGGKLLGRITSGLDTGAHQLVDFGGMLGDRFRSAFDEGGHQWSDFGGKLLGRFTSGFSAGAHQLVDFGGKIPGWLWDGRYLQRG